MCVRVCGTNLRNSYILSSVKRPTVPYRSVLFYKQKQDGVVGIRHVTFFILTDNKEQSVIVSINVHGNKCNQEVTLVRVGDIMHEPRLGNVKLHDLERMIYKAHL